MTDEPEENLDEQIAEASAELEALNEQAEQELAGETGTDLVPVTQSAEDARLALAKQRASAIRMREEIASKARNLARLQERKVQVLERRAQRELERMERHLAPLQEKLKQLEEGVWTINLYLGRDEEIVRLHKGDPAPADAPVVVRQLVLAMDMECAVAAEGGGIDSLNHEEFDAWLQEDWAHVEQVIPEEKCVVACVPRYFERRKHYDDQYLQKRADEGNDQTYFLIRNGGMVYRTWTNFQVGRTLVPKRDEFTKYFERKQRDGTVKPLEPGSEKWVEAEKAASHRQRDYMRVALILEGLLHRTTVFHPLPEEGISFTDARSHEEGRVRFVMDAENLLGSGRESFKDWLKRLNAQLRPGMRVVGNFHSQGWYRANERDEGRRRGHSRIRGAGGGIPDTGAIYRIEDREKDGALVIRYHPEGTRLVEDGETPYPGKPGYVYRYKTVGYKRRKSCLLYPEDDFILPYDLVTVEECQAYLDSRVERPGYVQMFPVLKAVIRAKRAEESLEAPFRQMLVGVLARDTGASVEQAEADVPDLVRWYKLANRIHRPIALHGQALPDGVDWDEVDLVSQDPVAEDAAKPIRLITAEYKRRLRDRERGHSDERLNDLKQRHPEALVIARLRSGPYVVLEAEDDRNVYVHELHYYARWPSAAAHTGLNEHGLKLEKRWVLPGTRPTRWVMLHTSERWADWDLAATAGEHLTGPELEDLLEQVKAKYPADKLAAVNTREGHDDDYQWDGPMPGNLFAEAWVSDEDTFSQMRLAAHMQRWERRGGKPVLLGGDVHGYGYAPMNKDDDSFPRPWAHTDDYGRRRDRVFYENAEVVRAHREEKARRQANRKRKDRKAAARDEAIGALLGSIKVQWLQPRYDQVWRKFLDDYADPGLWEGHRKQHRDLLPEFPHGRSGSRRSMRDTAPPWVRAVEALVDGGLEPWGMTVAEAQALAHTDDRFTMKYDDWDELTIWSEASEGGSRVGEGKRDPSEVVLADPPGEIAGLVFDKDAELVEPWAEPLAKMAEDAEAEADEWERTHCRECGEELGDRAVSGMTLCEDCDPEADDEDYEDVEFEEDELPALPAGEQT